MICLESVPKIREILLDEEMDEQEFIGIINNIYKQDCYIYAIIPEWEEALFDELSNDFNLINKITFPLKRIFPRTIGFLGFVKDSAKRYMYEFYSRHETIDFLFFSEFDVSQQLNNVNKENIDIYKIVESNKISHITMGSDGKWLNVVEF